jgi:hypothetical protein
MTTRYVTCTYANGSRKFRGYTGALVKQFFKAQEYNGDIGLARAEATVAYLTASEKHGRSWGIITNAEVNGL